jgi:hypothetical protein
MYTLLKVFAPALCDAHYGSGNERIVETVLTDDIQSKLTNAKAYDCCSI